MNVLVVTAYCESDAERCVQLYNWIGKLGGIKNRVLFVTDRTTKHPTIQSVCAAAKPVCAGYETILIDPCPLGPKWPKGANWAFMHASKKVKDAYKCPFLWLEPDCSPTKTGWMEALEKEYAESGKPYMGSMMTNKPPLPVRGMWGIAVYHHDVHDVFVRTTAKRINIAFDVTMADSLVPIAHDTKLIQCINGPGRVPQRIKPEHINPETVLLHQDKFGDVESILGVEHQPIDVNPVSDVTVVITNYKRPDHLRACFKSCMQAKVANIVVSSSAMNDDVLAVHKEIARIHPATILSGIQNDLGCNETWLRGVRLAKTSKVTILHDDDWLLPAYEEVVSGKFSKADIVHWDGAKHLDGKRIDGTYNTRPDLAEGIWPIGNLLAFLLHPSTHTISPVGGLFPRQHIIEVLEECESNLTGKEFHTRPSMMVGNDLMLWLRACEKFKTVAYTHIPRISYGHWKGSESYKDCVKHEMKLLPCYVATRSYWQSKSPRIYHTISRYHITNQDARERFRVATNSWEIAYFRGIVCPVSIWALPRNSWSIGDLRQTHFIKDVLRAGMERATRSDDIICLTNDDTVINQYWWHNAYTALKTMGAVCSFRRDIPVGFDLNVEDYPNQLHGIQQYGRDAFAFRKDWLQEHIDEIPDYVIGYGDWDSTIAMLIRLTHGHKSTREEFLIEQPTSELPTKFIYHHNHSAYWDTAGPNNPGNAHNRSLTNKFFEDRLGWEMPKLKGGW